MNNSKARKVTNGLKLISVAMAAAIFLRAVQMSFFFDFDTGFYTDGGLTAWLSLLLPVAAVAAAAVLCWQGKETLGPWGQAKRPLLGVLAALSGVLLISSAVVMAADFKTYLDTGMSQYESIRHEWNHVSYIVLSFLFGVVQLAGAGGYLTGRDALGKLPLLYVIGVLWGASNLVMVYVFYAKSSSTVENLFSMVGAAALLLALLYLCRLFSGVGAPGAALRLFLTGGLTVVLVLGYQAVNLALLLAGRTYEGEMPPQCQLSELGMAIFVLGAMLSYWGTRPEEGPASLEE